MNKKIEIINIKSPLLEWLIEKLKSAPIDVPNSDDLLIALNNLLDGISESILLEISDDGTVTYDNKQIHCKDLTIYVNSRKVTRGDQNIILTPKEFDILYFLARNRGEVFTKEQIYQAVWQDDYLLDDSNIMAFIRKLRKKIEVNPDSPEYIITIWGTGYKFTDD